MTQGYPATLETWRKVQDMYTRVKRMPWNPASAFGIDTGESFNHGKLPAPTLAKAWENIDHNSVGKVTLTEILGTRATSGATTQPTVIDPEQLRDISNFMCPRIWLGAPVLIEYCTVPQSGGIWIVTKAWSATRLRGQVTSALSGAGTYTMDNLIQLDGYYPVESASTTVSFSNVFGDSSADNAIGIVEWNDASKVWELTAIVCA